MVAFSLGGLGAVWPARPADVGVPGSPIAESADFATRELRDPWDMEQYSDVSQYLNDSGQQLAVSAPAVADGLFTGQSIGDINNNGSTARFYPLFPGYGGSMEIGKVGHRYPIDSATYHCLYIAMQVNSPAPNGFGPDIFRLFWFGDSRLNSGGADWGGAFGSALYPEVTGGTPTPSYRLYKIDLATASLTAGNTNWKDRATWEGLRIDPTINAGVAFSIDWVRLTTCASNNQTFTWTPNLQVKALWLKLAGKTRFIRIANNLSGSSGTGSVDLQGVPPGSYTVAVGDDKICCVEIGTTALIVNQTPIVEFARPSFFSGQDYASQAGGPWNFDSPNDISRPANISYSIAGGLLDTTTPSGPLPGGVDAQFFLRWPQLVAGSTFRYLSFRILNEWNNPWQNVPHGMIARLTWIVQGNGGAPNSRCYSVSQAIPLDVGWQNYWIDLGDVFNGAPVGQAGECAANLNWVASPPILDLRFDPNENITVAANAPGGGGAFHQVFDWMRLTAIDHVQQGTPFPIELSLNRDVSQLTYYYTTDRNDPTQALALPFSAPPQTGPFFIFLPFLSHNAAANPAGLPVSNNSFEWDTTGVASNVYYICVAATSGGNSATYCSEAPVIVD